MDITVYQVFLGAVMLLWPVAIVGLLWLMSKLESYVNKLDADTPEEAGLEPVEGQSSDKEVKIVFGGKIVGDSDG
jgi:hypothetical protein